ncbi:MAG: hypothetical protein J1E64_10695 [Acetatifactor sp.]|nr:hypothetical protein [Acetatifactor sp.]
MEKFKVLSSKVYKILKMAVCIFIAFICFVYISYIIFQYIVGFISVQELMDQFPLVFIFLVMSVLFFCDLTIPSKEKSKEVEKYYTEAKNAIIKNNQLQREQAKEDKSNEQATDIIELMFLNMKEIKEYYILSKTMAKRSFCLAVIMCILGFIVISSSIVAIFLKDISFIELLVPVIGGAIVEVIAGTSLVVYKKSLEQLNQYYDSLHNNERFLSLVNLVDKLNNDKKDETYINIINNQLEVLKNTQ